MYLRFPVGGTRGMGVQSRGDVYRSMLWRLKAPGVTPTKRLK
jgi:hypothetical protein